MKRLQSSAPAKAIAVLLLTVFLFLAGLTTCRLLSVWDAVTASTWFSVYGVEPAIETRADSVAALFALRMQRDELQAMADNGQDVAYRLNRVEEQIQEAEEALARSDTNFLWRVSDIYGNHLDSNLEDWDALEDEADYFRSAVFTPGNNFVVHDGEEWITWSVPDSPGDSDQDGTPDPSADSDQDGPSENEDVSYDEANPSPQVPQPAQETIPPYLIEYGLPLEPSAATDEFSSYYQSFYTHKELFPGTATALTLFSLGALVCLAWLLWSCGHRTGTEEIVTGWQEKIFLDLWFVLAAALFAGLLAAFLLIGDYYLGYYEGWYHPASEYPVSMMEYGLSALFTLMGALVALFLRTVAVRLKAGTFLHDVLLLRLCIWLGRKLKLLFQAGVRFVLGIPVFWKAAAVLGAYMLLSLYLISDHYPPFLFLLIWVLYSVALLLGVGWWCIGFHHLRKGTRAIAAGDLDHRIETRFLLPDLRMQGEDLNNISLGLNSALEEKIRSERFKAELITNVSHDLKTPLTSIINYVSLLKSTTQTDPKAEEYIEVLDRKSQRLKKLTEDLVEASKASTGVLRVEREKIGMSQLIDQATAEWAEKLEAQRLTLVLGLPEGETFVQADGRHLWRVLDNLLSNCSKYALEGTRIYLDLARGKGQVTLSVKNISREPLNIPPERLMERFVRGEESRTSEGSGLGLSIARSLTELQGGTFELFVDGDLFKAVITLPQAA